MSLNTVKTAIGTVTNITGEDLDWLRECMEIQADQIAQHADEMAHEARQADARNADDAYHYRQRAEWKREEAHRSAALAALLATATQVDILSEVTE